MSNKDSKFISIPIAHIVEKESHKAIIVYLTRILVSQLIQAASVRIMEPAKLINKAIS
jgi:hypothetical protein